MTLRNTVKDPFRGAYFWRGLSKEGNLRFQIDWASLRAGGKFTVLLCIWRQCSMYKPPRGLYLEGPFNGGVFVLPVWGAYIWRDLYMEGLIFRISVPKY